MNLGNTREELENADVNLSVLNLLALSDNTEKVLTFYVKAAQICSHLDLAASVSGQVEVLVMVIHAINNAGVASRIAYFFNAGLLLIIYDADCPEKTVISNSIPITSLTET